MKPRHLYKYQSFNTFSLQNLKNNTIYFNDPKQFNDPYDTSQPLEILELKKETLINLVFGTEKSNHVRLLFDKIETNEYNPETLIEYLFRISNIVLTIKEELLNKLRCTSDNLEAHLRLLTQNREHYKNLKEYASKVLYKHLNRSVLNSLELIRIENISKKGVSCFSENWNDLLMWAYYADGHKGFCLEFDTNYEPFTKLHQVQYVDALPKVDSNKIFTDGEDQSELVKAFLATKYKDWSHEKEWRVVLLEKNKEYTFKPNALCAIYFGSNMPLVQREIISIIIKSQHEHIKYYQVINDSGGFALKAQNFQYYTFQEAKIRVKELIKDKLDLGIFNVNYLSDGIDIGASKEQIATLIEAILDDLHLNKSGR